MVSGGRPQRCSVQTCEAMPSVTCRSVCCKQHSGVIVEAQQDIRIGDVSGNDCGALHLGILKHYVNDGLL